MAMGVPGTVMGTGGTFWEQYATLGIVDEALRGWGIACLAS